MPRDLNAFAGSWTIVRTITDHLSGAVGQMNGKAVLTPTDRGMDYYEQGTLVLPGQPPLQASRSYCWTMAGGEIAVNFADGRFFHGFDPNADQPTAHHDCPPDTYDVAYDFRRWPGWTAIWRVRGPRKDYVIMTEYSRA